MKTQLSDDEVLKRFQASIDIDGSRTRKPFVVGMIGLVGSGKSTVAKALADRLRLYVASNDAIRRFMNKLGFDGEAPNQPLLQHIAESTTVYLAKKQMSHIIDNDLLKFHELARQNVESHGMTFYLVRVVCPEDVILQRIEARTRAVAMGGTSNHSLADDKTYYHRKQVHAETPLPERFDFIFDTSKDLGPQVEDFVAKLQREGVL